MRLVSPARGPLRPYASSQLWPYVSSQLWLLALFLGLFLTRFFSVLFLTLLLSLPSCASSQLLALRFFSVFLLALLLSFGFLRFFLGLFLTRFFSASWPRAFFSSSFLRFFSASFLRFFSASFSRFFSSSFLRFFSALASCASSRPLSYAFLLSPLSYASSRPLSYSVSSFARVDRSITMALTGLAIPGLMTCGLKLRLRPNNRAKGYMYQYSQNHGSNRATELSHGSIHNRLTLQLGLLPGLYSAHRPAAAAPWPE